MSDSEIKALREAYTVWQSLPTILEYGPLRAYQEHARVQQLWRDTIDPAVGVVSATDRKLSDETHLVEAPSPWHAYFYLRAQQQYLFRLGRPLNSPPSDAHPNVGEHLFFRGQRCADWPFVSSLSRKDPATQQIETRAVAALSEYFGSMFARNEDVAANTAHCFAQHYGIATHLADVTCDPDIAVWFATHPVEPPCPTGERYGTVRAVTWLLQEEGARTKVLLAPPFVRNVYEQRGLFLDTSETKGLLAGKLQLEVRFPRATAGGDFEVLRGGRPLEVWPPPDESEVQLVNWAREMGRECLSEDEIPERVQDARRSGSLPRFWLERDLWNFQKHVVAWLSILDWILPATCVTALPLPPGSPKPMRYEILEAKMRALIRANPTFFLAFADAADPKVLASFEIFQHMVEITRRELGE